MADLNWQRQADGISLRVWAQPGASKTAIVGIQGDALKIALQARPVEGAANEALIKALAGWFDVRRSAVTIRHGEQQRQKLVAIHGDPENLADRLATLTASFV
jgi:uncharacterized protein (TIGR00251 family)